MRLTFLLILLVAVLFGSGYWYTIFDATCDVPIRYRIGEIDPRFGTDRAELMRITASAEALWESRLGRELFAYDDESDFSVNLVFDERQENANAEAELREDLEAKEGMSTDVAKKYDALIAEFRKLKRSYESRVIAYDTKLGSYNREVEEWNGRGGAPKAVIEELTDEAEALKREQGELEVLAAKLNDLVRQLNALGARANTLIEDYNTVVEEYNERIGESGEFTQGDYTRKAISVYQFNSEEELTLVLAHEFGHALGIPHVENPESIMYYHMGAQSTEIGVTAEDALGFSSVCRDEGVLERLLRFFGSPV